VILERERERERVQDVSMQLLGKNRERERERESRGIKDCFDKLLLRVRANKVTAVFLVI
jgi:hypothetical protein